MPTYDYQCPECKYTEEQIHSMTVSPEIICPKCNGQKTVMKRLFSPPLFTVKGGTETTHYREKRNRLRNNRELEKRQIERYGSGPRIKPNVAGVETDSWSDAAKLAKEAGMSTESYQPMIEKEKHTSKTSNIDDRAWKKAKED